MHKPLPFLNCNVTLHLIFIFNSVNCSKISNLLLEKEIEDIIDPKYEDIIEFLYLTCQGVNIFSSRLFIDKM